MPDHYYTQQPGSEHDFRQVTLDLPDGRQLHLQTDAGTFSRDRVDPGSRLLIDSIPPFSGHCADIGCGWGAIGLTLAAKNPKALLTMVDVNSRAVALAKENAAANGIVNVHISQGDALSGVEGPFDLVVTNPPIRAGKSVVYGFFAQAAEKLTKEGSLYAVIRKQQGAPSAKTYLESLFERVETVARQSGYWVICASCPKR